MPLSRWHEALRGTIEGRARAIMGVPAVALIQSGGSCEDGSVTLPYSAGELQCAVSGQLALATALHVITRRAQTPSLEELDVPN